METTFSFWNIKTKAKKEWEREREKKNLPFLTEQESVRAPHANPSMKPLTQLTGLLDLALILNTCVIGVTLSHVLSVRGMAAGSRTLHMWGCQRLSFPFEILQAFSSVREYKHHSCWRGQEGEVSTQSSTCRALCPSTQTPSVPSPRFDPSRLSPAFDWAVCIGCYLLIAAPRFSAPFPSVVSPSLLVPLSARSICFHLRLLVLFLLLYLCLVSCGIISV